MLPSRSGGNRTPNLALKRRLLYVLSYGPKDGYVFSNHRHPIRLSQMEGDGIEPHAEATGLQPADAPCVYAPSKNTKARETFTGSPGLSVVASLTYLLSRASRLGAYGPDWSRT